MISNIYTDFQSCNDLCNSLEICSLDGRTMLFYMLYLPKYIAQSKCLVYISLFYKSFISHCSSRVKYEQQFIEVLKSSFNKRYTNLLKLAIMKPHSWICFRLRPSDISRFNPFPNQVLLYLVILET